ncbi:restriction endonuclease subunit S [Nostoc sp. FACHB-133]|uniref:restriction endonuclease subunit S n=1 Tax=Nostoc sp. FACHB-133 TaxID=2692835 RepID=UPI0016859EE9|nr:restriction endonuclease subunit S [Nostoc sp. FACHB-133]MBD2526836.1 restriction endonuclease subunit S [Nostoc sp. FACHB-133]
MSVPKLRFKDENGQDFPDWEEKRLNKVICERSEISNDNYPIYSLTIQDGVTPKTDRYEREHLVTDKSNAYKLVKKNDFAYNPMNLRFGAIARYSGDSPVRVSKYYNVFYCNNLSNSLFFETYLKTTAMISFYDRMASGSLIEKKRVHFGDFLRFKIPIASIQEQTKIADFLITIDEKIAQLTQKCELLARYKKGVMQQLFSQKLRFKDDDGCDFPDWEDKKIGAIATFLKGKGISKADILKDGDTPCIRYGELYTEYSETIQEVKSKTNVNRDELQFSKSNDVIIPASGETQIDIAKASCVLISGVALGGDLNIIRSKENGIFIAYYLNSQKKLDIAKLAQGNSVVHLYASQLKLLDLTIPIKSEQTKIANFLTTLDEKITQSQTYLETVKQYKQGLLQQMFI